MISAGLEYVKYFVLVFKVYASIMIIKIMSSIIKILYILLSHSSSSEPFYGFTIPFLLILLFRFFERDMMAPYLI